VIDYSKEHRAWQLLQWQPWSLPHEFDEDLAAKGYYTDLQRKRSDQALDAWDQEHAKESSPELAAFQELERQGVYGQRTYFSPAKAKDGFYTKRLKQRQAQRSEPSGFTGPSHSTEKRSRKSRWRFD